MTVQIASLVLPTGWADQPTYVIALTVFEPVSDLVTHVSLEVLVRNLQEKRFTVRAVEVVAAGVPGNLWVWVELSPYPSVARPEQGIASTNYWAAIGGGGGPVAPLAPVIVVPTGVNAAEQTAILPWTAHSEYARLVVQMPVAATPATDFWNVQVLVEGKD